MDYYDDDFEEDIADDSIGKELTPQKQTPIKKTRLPTISSQPNLKSQGGVRGISGDKNKRGSIRKTLVLTKAQPKRDSQDYYMPPLKNISQPKSLNKYNIEDSARRNYTPTHSDVPQMGFKKRIIKEFDLESLGISRSSVKKSSRSTPRALEPVVITYTQRFKDVLDSDKAVKSVKELEIENIKLRDHLKELNGQLTQIVERAKNTLLPPKKVEFKNKDVEARVKTLSKEISNQQQILEFSFAEYTTLKARLDKLKDHDYAIDLDERIQEIVQQTEEIRRKNKAISAKAGSLAKDLKVIETKDGVPPAVVEANEKGRELALTRKKTRKMQEDNKAFKEEAKRKNEKYEKVQKEYKKLCKEAEKHNLTAEANKLAVHYKYLQNQIKSLEDGIKFSSNTNEKFVQNQLEKDIEELHLENLKENETLLKLDEMLAQQRAALKNMIETEVSPVDRETKEVLKRIKHAIEPENLEDSTSPAEIKVSHPKKNKSLGNLHSKPPITANKKAPNEMYADLPLYSSPLEKKKDSYKENKEMIKKELSAIREQARRDVEENKSRSPEKPVKEEKKVVREKFELHPAKPSKKESPIEEVLKPKEDKPWFGEKVVEQSVKKSEPEDSSAGLKPAFSKPNLFKKNKGGNDDLLFNNEPLSLADKPKENINNNEFKLPIQSEVKKDNIWDMPKKEEPLKLDALGNGKTNQNAFSTETFGINKKKEELIIPGSGSLTVQPKQVEPPKKTELILGDNLKPTPKQPEQNNEEDLGEGFNIGGISRLNRVKRVPNNNTSSFGEPEKKEALQLPGQKPLELGNGTQPFSLNKNNDLWLEPNKNQTSTKQLELELPGGTTRPDNKLQLNDAFGGNKNKTPNELSDLNTELLAGGFGQPKRVGRDRAHLFGKQDEQDPFVANTNTTTGATNAKSNFDPDDLFVSNNKVNNVESKTGMGNAGGFGVPVANTNTSNNPVGGAGVGGIPGVRTGRGGVATRPKQVNAFDDDLFGAEKKTTVVTQGSFGFGGSTNNPSLNRQATNAGAGFGGSTNNNQATNIGAGFGGASVTTPETNKEQGTVKENNNAADQQPKRMRMGDAQQKAEATREREKQLANKAHVDGFFGDFDF